LLVNKKALVPLFKGRVLALPPLFAESSQTQPQ